MFETFKEEYNKLEKYYDEKNYDKVIREGGKIIEGLVAYIFRTFPSTLKSSKQKQLYIEFERSFQKDNSNRFLDFIARPTIGVSIGYYIKLYQKFSSEKHPWLIKNINSSLDIVNTIRNKFAHSGDHKPTDDDASDLLDAFEIIIEELNLQNETPNSIGIPLSVYLIYSSIMYNFDNVAKKEQDWKGIIADARKIIPQLLECFFYSKYYEISFDDKGCLYSDLELVANEDKDNNLTQYEIYENILKKLELVKLTKSRDNVGLVVQKYLSIKKDKYDRRGVKPYTKLLNVMVEELINPNYVDYLKYAVMVKNKYLNNNEIDDKERIELLSFASSMNVSSKTAYKIEKEVIDVINNELTLYQTLQCPTNESEDSEKISQAESILIEMIKKGTPEEIVVSVANSQDFKGDVYNLLTNYGNKNSTTHQKKRSKKKENDSIEDSNVIYGKAIANYKGGDYNKSIEYFSQLIAIDPANVEAFDYRGTCYYYLKKYKEANQDYSESIKLKPTNSTVFYNRANCFFALKEYSMAITDYSEMIKLSPSSEKAYYYRALCYFYIKDYDKAFSDFEQSIKINPNNPVYYNSRANCLYSMKKYNQAIMDYDLAIKLNLEDSSAYLNRAHCYYSIKNYDKAILDYSEKIKLSPKSQVALSFRGYSFKNIKKYAEAIADFNAVLELNPGDTAIIQHRDFAEKKLNEMVDEKSGDRDNYQPVEDTDEDLKASFLKHFYDVKKEVDNNSPYAGSHLKIKIPLTLEEIYSGVEKKIKLNKFNQCSDCGGSGIKQIEMEVKCPVCNGTGTTTEISKTLFGDAKKEVECQTCEGFGYTDFVKCPNCEGEGRVKEETVVSIDVPAGVIIGQVIELKGLGNAGRRGKPTGILFCEFEEKEHEYFSRQDLNIFYNLDITKKKAEKGAKVVIPTLAGKVKLTIPDGIKTGEKLCLTGKGLPLINSKKCGDMFIQINIL